MEGQPGVDKQPEYRRVFTKVVSRRMLQLSQGLKLTVLWHLTQWHSIDLQF